MRVAAERVSRASDVEAKLKWLIEQEGPALLEVITDRKVPVLPMVPSGRGLHEFLVYDEGKRIYLHIQHGTQWLTLYSQGEGAQGSDAEAKCRLRRQPPRLSALMGESLS